jgi:hypothetical protein
MTELDLLNLARSATQNEVSWFTQIITINFAMVVAIYYFLGQAKLALRVFGFVAYILGSLIFLGEMLIESNLKGATLTALKALPAMAGPTRRFIGTSESWLGMTTAFVFNASFWVLWIGIFYLLFFWKKSAHVAD